MSWSFTIPSGTRGSAVLNELRKMHQDYTDKTEMIKVGEKDGRPIMQPKGLSQDTEDQINAAIKAVDALWHEVTDRDVNGAAIGTIHGQISGDGSKTISVTLTRD